MQTFQLPSHTLASRAIEFTPDGMFLGIGRIPFSLLNTVTGSIQEIDSVTDYRRAKIVLGGGAVAHISWGLDLTVTEFQSNISRSVELAELQANEVAANPDGRLIYVDGLVPGITHITEIQAFDALTLEQRGVIGRHGGSSQKLAISADGTRLASDGGSVRVWNISSGKMPPSAFVRATVKGDVNDFALSPDGEFLAIAESHGLALWNTRARRMIARSGKHRRAVEAVICAPVQPLFLTGDSKGKVFMWDATGRALKQYDWGLGQIAGLAFAPDGMRAAALDFDGKVVIWDVDV